MHIYAYTVCLHTSICMCTQSLLWSPNPAHSNTVMLLTLFLHLLPMAGLFQGTNPAAFLSQSFVLANALCGRLVRCSSPLASEKQPSLQPYCWLFILWRCFWDALGPPSWHSLYCLREDLNKSKMYLPFAASNPQYSCLLNGMRCLLSAPPFPETVGTHSSTPWPLSSSMTGAGWARAGDQAQHREA